MTSRLRALSFAYRDEHGNVYINCICKCGTKTIVQLGSLNNGHTKSCGCLRNMLSARRLSIIGKSNYSHGETLKKRTPEYRIWSGLKDRTTNPKSKDWSNYGGRGIKVCRRWDTSYLTFLEDMGRRPTLFHSIDRIDNNGDYSPKNCRWATRSEQACNRRPKNG